MIHGDVFRPPPYSNIFCAIIGAGAQIFATVLILLVCVLVGAFKVTKRGALLTAIILIFALCAVFGGMVSARYYKELKGKNWVWNVVLTSLIMPVPLSLVFAWVNTVAWQHESTAAIPVTTIAVSILFLFIRASNSVKILIKKNNSFFCVCISTYS
jgi:dolichyl-phosphate-mannose--protein O-mannosyl transferase